MGLICTLSSWLPLMTSRWVSPAVSAASRCSLWQEEKLWLSSSDCEGLCSILKLKWAEGQRRVTVRLFIFKFWVSQLITLVFKYLSCLKRDGFIWGSISGFAVSWWSPSCLSYLFIHSFSLIGPFLDLITHISKLMFSFPVLSILFAY